MEITVTLRLTADEKRQLAAILGCQVSELSSALDGYCSAAAEEYVRMFLGQKVFTRGSDIREYRLLLLIQHALDGHIPKEQQISDLFQTTVTQSRSLTRSVMSKFQYELSAAINQTLEAVLEDASLEEENDQYVITVDNENLVDAMNRRLQAIDGTLPSVSKRRGTVSTYNVPRSSFNRLREHLGT
jgi:hypothetical protein